MLKAGPNGLREGGIDGGDGAGDASHIGVKKPAPGSYEPDTGRPSSNPIPGAVRQAVIAVTPEVDAAPVNERPGSGALPDFFPRAEAAGTKPAGLEASAGSVYNDNEAPPVPRSVDPNPESSDRKEAKFKPQYSPYVQPEHLALPPIHIPSLRDGEAAIAESFREDYRGPIKSPLHRLLIGHPVATEGGLRSSVRSYSTVTGIVEVGLRKYFIIYNYPGSDQHRNGDTACRKAWGEKALKPTEARWREVFMRRSLIPAVEGGDPRIVLLPFIPNISLVDILGEYDGNKFNGDYAYGGDFAAEESKIAVAQEVAAALYKLHAENITRGEVIPSNIGITNDKRILFFDPETPYEEGTSPLEQKARDLFSWCVSACGALHKSPHKIVDYDRVVKAIFDAYGDTEVIEFLQKNLSDDLKFGKIFRHPIAYFQFKARLGMAGRKQYNQILATMREYKLA